MSSKTPQNDSSTITPSISEGPELLPFRPEVFDSSTKKQRFILLSARDAVIRGDPTIAEVARLSDSDHSYVKRALTKYIHRKDLPAACAIASRCTPSKDFEDLTRTQQRIINEFIINPEQTQTQIGKILRCSPEHVHGTLRVYSDLVHERTPEVMDTPEISSNIPLDFQKDTRDDDDSEISDEIPEDRRNELLQAFEHDLLMDLTPNKRFILLAAREWALRGKGSVTAVAQTTDTNRTTVENFLADQQLPRETNPVATATADVFFENFTYESLTDNQRQIVNQLIVNPDANLQSLSERVGVTYQSTWRTKKVCQRIIHEKRHQ